MEPKFTFTCAILDKPAPTIAKGIDNLRVVQSQRGLELSNPNEVLVRIRSTCLNYPDLLMLSDQYQHKPTFPFTPGLEWSGIVLRVGTDVTNVRPGDRVLGSGQGLSSHLCVEANSLTLAPSKLSFSEVASFTVGFNTAYHCLVERAKIQRGEWVLINGATGGMGMAAVLLCRHLGAHVVCTGGTNEKLKKISDFADIPWDCCLNYCELTNYAKQAKACTPNGRGVDIVFDPVGGAAGMEALRSTAWGARVLVVGFTSGVRQQYPANYLLIKVFNYIDVQMSRCPDVMIFFVGLTLLTFFLLVIFSAP